MKAQTWAITIYYRLQMEFKMMSKVISCMRRGLGRLRFQPREWRRIYLCVLIVF